MRVLLVDDDVFLAHRSSHPHPERPERLLGARAGLARFRDRMTTLPARRATDDDLSPVHDRRYLESLREATARGRGHLDADTYFGPGSLDAALAAAGGSIDVARALAAGEAEVGVCLVRPPGHHAERDRAMGFCLLNNVACAAAAARDEGRRVLVVDWDVHHGNGTEHTFEGDPGVLFFSVHQSPFYPGTGAATDLGRDEGAGFTVNVPLCAGAGDASYASAFRELLEPVARAFAPDLAVVSAGFDAGASDPLAGMEVTSAGFRALGAAVRRLAPRVALVLEGGYDVEALGEHLAAAIDGVITGVAPAIDGAPRPTDLKAIERVRETHRRFWPAL